MSMLLKSARAALLGESSADPARLLSERVGSRSAAIRAVSKFYDDMERVIGLIIERRGSKAAEHFLDAINIMGPADAQEVSDSANRNLNKAGFDFEMNDETYAPLILSALGSLSHSGGSLDDLIELAGELERK